MEIKVCGPGCAKCTEAEQIVKDAVSEAGIKASVVKVTDFQEMAMLGVLTTPAIVIDDHIKCVGKVPTKKEMLSWLQ